METFFSTNYIISKYCNCDPKKISSTSAGLAHSKTAGGSICRYRSNHEHKEEQAPFAVVKNVRLRQRHCITSNINGMKWYTLPVC